MSQPIYGTHESVCVCVCVCRQSKPGVKYSINIEPGLFWDCGRQGEVEFSINMLHRGGNNCLSCFILDTVYLYRISHTHTHTHTHTHAYHKCTQILESSILNMVCSGQICTACSSQQKATVWLVATVRAIHLALRAVGLLITKLLKFNSKVLNLTVLVWGFYILVFSSVLSLRVFKEHVDRCFQWFGDKKAQRKRYNEHTVHYFGKHFLPSTLITLLSTYI